MVVPMPARSRLPATTSAMYSPEVITASASWLSTSSVPTVDAAAATTAATVAALASSPAS